MKIYTITRNNKQVYSTSSEKDFVQAAKALSQTEKNGGLIEGFVGGKLQFTNQLTKETKLWQS